MCERFPAVLGNEQDVAWLPIVGFSGWSSAKFAAAASETFKLVAGAWRRLVLEFQMWPRRLIRAFDSTVDAQERLRICQYFVRFVPAHLEPGLARPIRSC
eukprot:11374998-Alexandrium_andersonii.AAC.1